MAKGKGKKGGKSRRAATPVAMLIGGILTGKEILLEPATSLPIGRQYTPVRILTGEQKPTNRITALFDATVANATRWDKWIPIVAGAVISGAAPKVPGLASVNRAVKRATKGKVSL